jgi:cyclophilin family peptidyl-prolyl cis-trans isomerase
MQLDTSISPKAVSAFVERVRSGFYNGLSFHRIAPGFVIQGGDPLGSGLSGPGYKTVDKPSLDQQYVRATVAMAKSPDQPAGTAGSQFFVVTGEDSQLTPDFAVIGEVTEGMATVDRISSEPVDPRAEVPGQPADGPPANPVVIDRMTVTQAS